MGVIHILKFKFAGSGDLVWRKVIYGKVPTGQSGLFKITENAGEIYISHGSGVTKAYGNLFLDFDNFNSLKTIISDELGKTTYVLDKTSMERQFGKQQCKAYIWLKLKEKKSKKGLYKYIHEFTIPGPLDMGGASDKGDFSIKNNVIRSLPVITNWIEDKLKRDEVEKIYVKIKGHSRGGVAANIILNKIAAEFNSNDKVEICSVTFDPVPGPNLVSDCKPTDTDSKSYNEIFIDDKIKGAVIYSINSGHSLGFEPQKVYNVPVIIISEHDHAVGLYDVYESKKKWYNLNGKSYSPGKLYKLPKGMYWADKNLNLILIDFNNYEECIEKIINNGQRDRKKFLEELILKRVLT